MKKTLFFTLLLCLFQGAEVYAQDVDTTDQEGIMVHITVQVMDTTATVTAIEHGLGELKQQQDSLVSELQGLSQKGEILKKRVEGLDSKSEFYKHKILQISNILEKQENKIKDPEQKEILKELLDLVVLSNQNNVVSEDSIATVIYINPSNFALYDYKPKLYDLNHVKKDAAKGKLTDPVKEYFIAIYSEYENMSNQLIKKREGYENSFKELSYQFNKIGNEAEELTEKINRISSGKDYEAYYQELTGSSDYPKKKMTVAQKITRPYGDDNSIKDIVIHTQGWEWVFDNLEEKKEHYPVNVTYCYSPEHPEYRLVGGYVYDSSGNLNRVLFYEVSSDMLSSMKNHYIKQRVIEDYKNNKYGILKQSSDVQYVIKNLLGLSDEHAKNNEKINQKVVQTVQNANGKSRRVQEKGAANIVGLIMAHSIESDRLKNKDAKNFITQCEEDHAGEAGKLWKVDRIDDTSFMVFLYNEQLDRITKYKVVFSSDEPYATPTLKWSAAE